MALVVGRSSVMGNPLETIAAVQEIEGQAAERRHLEMMAATIAAGITSATLLGPIPEGTTYEYYCAQSAVTLARAIQEEVRR